MGAILAPIAGAVLGGIASRPRGSTTSVQTAEPWSGVKPALSEMYAGALSGFRGPAPQYYPGSTVAPLSGATNEAQRRLYDRATTGNPLLGSAQQQAQDTLSGRFFDTPATQGLTETARGDYLNANPYLDSMFQRASSAVSDEFRKNVMPGVESTFALGGRYGSNAMQEGMGQAQQRYGDVLGNLATDIYGSNYARERALQAQALQELGSQFQRERLLQTQTMGQAPELAMADYGDIAQLSNLGSAQDLYGQSVLQSDIDRWNFNQNQGRDQLAFLNSILQGAPMGRTTSESGGQYNPIMAALGGAGLGSRIFAGMTKPAPVSGFANGLFGAGTNPYSGEFMGSLEF